MDRIIQLGCGIFVATKIKKGSRTPLLPRKGSRTKSSGKDPFEMVLNRFSETIWRQISFKST